MSTERTSAGPATDPAAGLLSAAGLSALARADLLRALGVLAEPPGASHESLAELLGLPAVSPADWTEAFVVQLVPHASIYLGSEGMLGGSAADRIAGFWRALHLPVPADPDHIAALLGLYAGLLDAEHSQAAGAHRTLLRQARTALLHEHVLGWLVDYAHAMAEVGPPAYAAWASLVRQALAAEVAEVGAPDRLPSHLADAAAVEAPSLDALLDGLLSPARSGVLLTRAHLAALARDGGLGLRLGDRRRILRALVEQDPRRLLCMLADLADACAVRHRADAGLTGAIATRQAQRAAATAELLRGCASSFDAAAA